MSQVLSNNNNSFNIITNYTAPDDESKILAWLSPLEPWVRHRDIAAQRVDSVGEWLLETEEFGHWHKDGREDKSRRAALFCDGNPGVGKSYISSLVVDKLCDEAVEDDTAVTCFYFDYAARNEQSPINMLGSLLRQLVSGLEGIPDIVIRSFRNQRKVIGGRGLQVSGILKTFQTIAATKRTFICVDALDECVPGHRVEVLESLGQILQGSPDTRLFMTGRRHIRNEVDRILDGAANFVLIQAMEDGVVRYLLEKLRKDAAPEIMSGTLKANIIKSIAEISSETFLLASLHIEAVLRETTIARRAKRLRSLKDGVGLGDAYGATLERIKAQDEEKVKLAIATLTWICHSERPLQVDGLCHALAVEIGATDFDPENVPSIGTLLGCCQGLVTVDKEASTVRLIHFTVQEYLCAQPDLFTRPHSIIAEACLTYLNSQQINNLSPHPPPDHQVVPFLEYSSRYWGTHANRELSDLSRALGRQLLDRYKDHVSAVSLLGQVLHSSWAERLHTPPFTGLHCASFFGIAELVAALTNSKSCDTNERGCTDSTPLWWAAVNGHEEAVKILLGRENIDPVCPDNMDQSPLVRAAMGGHEGVVKLLLSCGDVDPNRPDIDDATPLSWAACKGHDGVVKLLLEREDVDPNKPDNQDVTPLLWAANSGHEGVVKLLLEREDVDPNRAYEDGGTPLGCAAVEGHEEVVKLLLKRGDVDPNRRDGNDRTPLGCAAIEGHEGVVKLLLEREDVNPNFPDLDCRTPLGCAAIDGHEAVVKLLLEWGDVDPNCRNKDGRTPLGFAALAGHERVVRLLLERGDVDPNCRNEIGRTPLGSAASKGHERVVKLLLEREDVDPNRSDVDDRTPLRCAVFNGHEAVVKLLLEREDVDPNRRDNRYGRTPLGSAAAEGHEAVVKLLLEREDVDPNLPDGFDCTPLRLASVYRHQGVVQLILGGKNADPNPPDEGC